jgi:peptide/nickel transport system substrate-binding protein
MYRRHLLVGSAAGLIAAPALVRAQAATTLKFIPYADLALLDPATSAFVTRNHVMMVFDTLYAPDESGVPQLQMLEGQRVEDDGLRWTLTLRDGLMFHDGTPVRGRDVVASIRRWSVRDGFGQALMAATDELSAPDDKTVVFRLKRRFNLLPHALAHPTNNVAAIMPERLAQTPATTQLSEITGSGPFRYVAAERVAGSRNVYAKFEGYRPRTQGTPSFCAGPRVAYFDRVEWQTTPDPSTQVAALRNGEVDWVEQPQMDLVGSLRRTRGINLQVAETKGLVAFLRFNHLFSPFDNPAIRRAVLKAVNQTEFMQAVVGENTTFDKCGVFGAHSGMVNDAGMEVLSGPHDVDAVRRELAAAGYKGEKVVFLSVTDVPRINAIAEMGADMLRKIGMNVDQIATDWGTVVQRTVSRQPLDRGGWSMYASFTGGIDAGSPGSNNLLRANGVNASGGWPTSAKLEDLRNQWLAADDLAARQSLARQIQLQAWEDVPFLPLGSYDQPTAFKSNLTNMLKGLILFTEVRRS